MSSTTHPGARTWLFTGGVIAATLLGSTPSARANPMPRVVLLSAPAAGEGAGTGLLVRELVRQALLMSAREECGALTRDELLRESVPAESKSDAIFLEVKASQTQDGGLLVQISKRDKDQASPLEAFRLKVSESDSIATLTSQLEPMVRRELVQVLKQAGLSAETREPASAKLPELVEKRLPTLVCLTQFSAVRAIHGAMRRSGESPSLLEGLARGYANLGTLTEVLWSPAHKVFKARALLYSERLVAKYPGPEAYRARAYVRALLGLHRAALDDLAASQKNSASTQPEAATDEAAIVEAFCRADKAKLAKAGSGDHKLLANYLEMLLAETSGLFEVRQRAAQAVLKANRRSMRAIETWINAAPLGVQRKASDLAMANFARSVYREVLEIMDLPDEVRTLASSVVSGDREAAHRSALVKSLEESAARSDTAEPSLAVAGLLIRETGFVHAWRWLHVRRHTLDWNVDGPLAGMRPLVEGHRYAPFIETHVWDRNAAAKPLKVIAELSTDPNLETSEDPMISYVGQFSPEVANAMRWIALGHGDRISRDLINLTRLSGNVLVNRRAAQLLREISPDWPATIAATILWDWEYAAPRAQELETKFADSPDVLENLATQFIVAHKLEDAERCLKRRVELLPDQEGYTKLAKLSRYKGDEAAWVKTLEQSLTSPSYGLERAGTLVELANHYTSKGDLKEAVKKADLAAESYSGWAMQCAADCHQRLEDFAGAEKYVRQTAERYESSAMGWYLWCRWTQHGDLNAARRLAESHLKTYEASQAPGDRVRAALFYYAEDRQDRALEILRQTFALGHDPAVGLQAALLADEMKNPPLRDSLLDESLKAAWFQQSSLAELIHDFQNALADRVVSIDTKVNEWRLHLLPAGEATARRYFIGHFLFLRGQSEGAVPLLRLAAASPFANRDARVFAGLLLARHAIKQDILRSSEWDKGTSQILDQVKQAYAVAQTGQFKEVERILNEALKAQPDSVDAHFARALISQAQRRFADAVVDYTECLTRLPNALELRLGRAQCEEARSDYAEALDDYEKVIARDPREGLAYLGAASILATCKDASVRDGKKAVQYANHCLDQQDNIAKWNKHFVLAAGLAETGDFKNAVAHGEMALNDAPEKIRPALNRAVNLYRNETPLRLGR
jgi:tetratricopeptide (TPR) repeat protein